MAVQAYCIKCKRKVDVLEGVLSYYHNGAPVEKGKCKECGSKVNRILSREERQALKESQKQEIQPEATD